ncbi:MAG: membrane protein of unknown function [Promethearchaeota archaeon]|nr:MAG: membrane protein of unknown function [Candidatus Lokiarchaeota archaeon]
MVRAIQLKMKNVYYISFGFFFIAIGFIGSLLFELGLIFEEFFVTTGFIFVALFTYHTFHKDRGSTPGLIILIILLLSVIHFILQIIFSFNPGVLLHLISKFFDIFKTFVIFFWLGVSSYRAYERIKNENVKDWIKMRYKLIAFSAFILSIQAVPELFMPYDVEYGDPQDFITLILFTINIIIALIFSGCFFVSWIIPKSLKNYINRNYQEREFQDLNEIEIIKKVKNDLNKKET